MNARYGTRIFKDNLGRLGGIDFNLNGWGQKQDHSNDAKVAKFVTGVSPLFIP